MHYVEGRDALVISGNNLLLAYNLQTCHPENRQDTSFIGNPLVVPGVFAF